MNLPQCGCYAISDRAKTQHIRYHQKFFQKGIDIVGQCCIMRIMEAQQTKRKTKLTNQKEMTMKTLNAAATQLVKDFAKTNKYSYTKLVDLVFAVQEVSATKTAGKVGRPVSEKTLELRDQVATFVAETKGNKFTTADVAAKFGCNLVQAKRVLESLQNVKEAGKVPNGGRGRPFVAYVAE